MNKCPHCGAEAADDAIVCMVCGKQIMTRKGSVTVAYTDTTGLVPKLSVYMDGYKIAEVGLSEKTSFEVDPGDHIFFVKEEFSECPKKKFRLEPGETLNLRLKSKAPNSIGSMYYMFFNPKNHFILEKFDT